jgi:hypothetical protein
MLTVNAPSSRHGGRFVAMSREHSHWLRFAFSPDVEGNPRWVTIRNAVTDVQSGVNHPVALWMDVVDSLLAWLLVDSFAEPDARSASIFFDELDTRGFKGPLYNVKSGSTWFVCVRLKLAHCYDADSGFVCEVLLTPVEKPTRSPTLFRCDHSSRMRGMADSINSIENRLTSSHIYYNHLYCN